MESRIGSRESIWRIAAMLLVVLLWSTTLDAGDDQPLPATDLTGFTAIFDGKSLGQWDGDPKYWSVHDGKLVGRVTPHTLLKKNSWIVWRGDRVEDFELVLDYRVSAEGNSGVGYRLAVLDNDPFSVRGPQADIHGASLFTGICYEENGRRLLAARGQVTWVDDHGGQPKLIAQFASPDELQGVVRRENWNRYWLVVKDRNAKHYLNGVLMSEVHDYDDANRVKQGLLGVQVHVGPPMTIEYRNIYLKHFGPPPTGAASRESVTYHPGSLLEREHQVSFDNLLSQTGRLTAAAADQPLDKKTKLIVVTRDLGVVRHDLTNVKLFDGKSTSKISDESKFDLIVMSGDDTVRVPSAGSLQMGKLFGRQFRVELTWNRATRRYEALDFASEPP